MDLDRDYRDGAFPVNLMLHQSIPYSRWRSWEWYHL